MHISKVFLFSFVSVCCTFLSVVAPPVKPAPADEGKADEDNDAAPLGLQYEQYLKEVVGLLERDEGFKKKLEEANITDVRSGKIAEHLELLGDDVRTQLDELKRTEIERLNQIRKLMDLVTSQGRTRPEDMPPSMRKMIHNARNELIRMGIDPRSFDDHLDKSSDNFNPEDLKKLIVKATKDLEQNDEQRRNEFKRYEMEKERQRREKLKKMSEIDRLKEQEKIEDMRKKHRDHPKLNHPGSKDQLEEVWEEDGMQKDDFDPKSFFYMHDTNGDGRLDENEVEALFIKELAKAYDPNAPEDDMRERDEEMNRMREHVYSEVDGNRDRYIDLDEFMKSTQVEDFDKKEAWDTLEEEDVFSNDEIEEFMKQRDEEKRRNAYDHDVAPGEIPLPRPVSDIPQARADESQNMQDANHNGQPNGQAGNDQRQEEIPAVQPGAEAQQVPAEQQQVPQVMDRQ